MCLGCGKMNIFMISGLAVVGTIICVLVKQYKPEYSLFIALLCGVIIFTMVITSLSPAFETMDNFIKRSYLDNDYIVAIIKTLGICYVTQFASDSCKDAGQVAIANNVELAGKVLIVITSLPLFENLLNIAFNLMRNR